MAQTREREPSTSTTTTTPRAPEGRPFPPGNGPVEYRQRKGVHVAEAGRVVKEAWVGRVCGRSVRVYRGAAEADLPPAVLEALLKSGVEIGVITLEELGLKPKTMPGGIVNLTRQQV